MEKEAFNYKQARAYASQFALFVGGMWIASFGCSMYSLDHPFLGTFGNITAILSLFLLVSILRQYRRTISEMNFVKCWWMAWMTTVYAALLTTFAQYIYFQFLDNGHLVNTLTQLFDMPEYKEMLQQIMPGIKLADVLKELAAVKISDIVINLLTFNITVSLVYSLIAALFGCTGGKRKTLNEQYNKDNK